VKIRFLCPECEAPVSAELPSPSSSPEVVCSACAHRIELGTNAPGRCAVCGNHELYKKKNFPHWLGMIILTAACIGFLVLMYQHDPYWAWAVLLGSAAFDGLLYLWVGDALVCYRCGAHYYGIVPGPEHRPFELTIGERYRQERLRREQLKP
jgi:DNA-directed RNA polymerase subunit RPC12/RpoP